MKAARRPMKLRTKILLSCLNCILVGMLVQLTLFNRSSSAIIARQAQTINDSTLQNLSDDLYQQFKTIENDLITIYEHKDFLRALTRGDIDMLRTDYASLAYRMAYDAFEPSVNLNALYLYTLNDQLICSYRHAQTPIYTYPEDIYDHTMKGSDEGVREMIAGKPSVMAITSYWNDKRQTSLVRCILRILENGKTPIGYLVCDVDPKGFRTLLEKYRYSDEQTLWFQPTGRAAPLSVTPEQPEAAEQYQLATTAIARGEEPRPNQSVLYTHPVRKYDLTLYSMLPLSALNANQNALWQTTLTVFILLLIVFAILFTLISGSLTQPLTRMVATMNRIKHGETALRLPQMKQDELGVLGSEFNDMLDRIEGLIAHEYQTTLQLNDAKYKALQMQVNPHFLYNTLDTMSAIAITRDCPLVSTICQALSSLFRYSLNMEEPLATLDDELRHLKNYLFVMNVRMQDSLHMTAELPTELLQMRVPRLSLQPIVENAVNHGLRNKRGEKRIALHAGRENGVLCVVIEDNGVGMEPETVEKALQFDPNAALGNGHSIGLRNINARVKLLFGTEYGLSITSQPGQGCRVTLRIPETEAVHA